MEAQKPKAIHTKKYILWSFHHARFQTMLQSHNNTNSNVLVQKIDIG